MQRDDFDDASEDLPPELAARLRPQAKPFRPGGGGYPNKTYIDYVRRVHETGRGRRHVERDFPNVSAGHVAEVMRRQAHLNALDVLVATDPTEGVCVMPAGPLTVGDEVDDEAAPDGDGDPPV